MYSVILYNKYKKTLLPLITLIIIGFIWGHSLMEGTVSADESGGVVEIIENILLSLNIKADVSEHIIRKIAHFSEFFLLSLVLYADVKAFEKESDTAISILVCLFTGLMTACADETIQLFSEGRSSSLMDVWIDFWGVLTAFVIMRLIYSIKKRGV